MTIKEALRDLMPYDPKQVNARIRLDANEQNLALDIDLDPSLLQTLNRYPQHQNSALLDSICQTFSYEKSNVILGSGSSELIDLMIKTFVAPKEYVLSTNPTFVMYEYYAKIANASYITVNESHQTLDELYKMYILKQPKIIIISNPNNPTGTSFKKTELIKLIQLVNCMIVIDEAYIEYMDNSESLVNDVDTYKNLFVTRSFSKAWGLAGARLGYVVSNEENIRILKIAKTPYSIPTLSAYLGVEALKQKDRVFQRVLDTISIRDNFSIALTQLGIDVFESSANFVYIHFDSFDLYELLLKRSVLIRTYKNGYYRISIGTNDEMQETINHIKELVQNYDQTRN
jgi:Histidinol-phosphate/aromatic aminotransferase and cobyric acid decarboxylase